MAKPVFKTAAELLAFGRGVLGESDWLTITQERVNHFADATNDHQWIHVDPERAKHSRFGACIAHGNMTLSLATHFLPDIYTVQMKMGVNYGYDRVRFPIPVKVGARIRGRAEMLAAERMQDGGIQVAVRVSVEVEGEPKPACVADTLSRFYFAD